MAVNGFLAKLPVLPLGSWEAVVYGELRAKQAALGKSLGNLDTLIASHAAAVGVVLVTNDKAFSQVKELHPVNWATDIAVT